MIGIKDSYRKVRANISNDDIVESSLHELDPKKQLRDAGYPFNYIGTELTELNGKLEVVSNDMNVFKEEIRNQSKTLSDKIDFDTDSINKSISDLDAKLSNKIDHVFESKLIRGVGWVVAIIATVGPIFLYIYSKVESQIFLTSLFVTGILLTGVLIYLSNRKKE